MEGQMTVSEQIEKVKEEICDKYCKYPQQVPPKGNENWMFESGSPCEDCPLNKL